MAAKGSGRTASVTRKTNETEISLTVDLGRQGQGRECRTGVGFFDHMLDQLARHSLIDMKIKAKGDLHIDDHHTVEDVGHRAGQGARRSFGRPRRHRALRLAGPRHGRGADARRHRRPRAGPYLVWQVEFPAAKIGSFDTELVRRIPSRRWLSMPASPCMSPTFMGATPIISPRPASRPSRRVLGAAIALDPRQEGAVPSTKGFAEGIGRPWPVMS